MAILLQFLNKIICCGTHLRRLSETLPMSTNNVYFLRKKPCDLNILFIPRAIGLGVKNYCLCSISFYHVHPNKNSVL